MQTKLNFAPMPSNGSLRGEEERVEDSEVEEITSSAPNTPPKNRTNGEKEDSDESEESELTDEDEISIIIAPKQLKADQSNSSSSNLHSNSRPSKYPSASILATSRTEQVGDVSTSTSAGGDTSTGKPRKRTTHGDSLLCHAHHIKCEELIRCTYLKKTNKRCPMKFCPRGIEMYGATIDQIQNVKRNGVHPSIARDHSVEEDFVFKCPRCQNVCLCAKCRRGRGLEPIQRQMQNQAAISHGSIQNGAQSNGHSSTSASTSSSNLNPPSKVSGTSTSSVPSSSKNPQAMKTAPSVKKSPSKFSIIVPVKRPPDLPSPELELISTSLPAENLFARAYIYETLNRFNLIKVPRSMVSKLDRFDQWTNKNAQDILERILMLLSGLDKLESGTPPSSVAPLVRAWRKSGKDLSRGEVWAEAAALVEDMDISINRLPEVDHGYDEESEEEEEELKPQPISSRLTRRKAAADRSARVYRDDISSEDSDDEESDSDSDDSSEHEDSDQSANPQRRSTRTKVTSKSTSKSLGDDSSASALRKKEEAKAREKKKEASKIPAPPFETKIQILVGCLDLSLATQNVADELKDASEGLSALERNKKEAAKSRDFEFHQQLVKHDESNPGPFAGEPYRLWQNTRTEMWQKKVKEDRDANVRFQLDWDALRLRSGPLGTDVDGNEYWQLSQSDKNMPGQTQGRYAWSLLVFGKPFVTPLSLKPTSSANPIVIDDDEDEEEQVKKTSLKRSSNGATKIDSSSEKDNDDNDSLSSAAESSDESPASNGHQDKKLKSKLNGKGKEKEKEVEEKVKRKIDGKSFFGTNFPREIDQVILFVRYRQQLKDYIEWSSLARDPKATRSSSTRLTTEQEQRRKKIDKLTFNLKQVKEFYIWHTGEE